MDIGHFFVTGSDGNTVLYSDPSSNGCVMWANEYTRHCFGGWAYLQLWEWEGVPGVDALVSTLYPADEDTPTKYWEDEA